MRNRQVLLSVVGVVAALFLVSIIVLIFRSKQSPTITKGAKNDATVVGGTNSVQMELLQKSQAQWQEAVQKTQAKDQDLDGLNDADEATYGTNPSSADTDGDGLSDYTEIAVTKTNPLKADTDSDGQFDGWEVKKGTNPLDKKSF